MVLKLLPRSYWFISIAAVILVVDSLLVRFLPNAAEDHLMAYGVLFDCMIVIPLLYWFLMIRKTGKPFVRLLPLPLLGGLVAWLILPVQMRHVVWNAVWPIELLIITVEVAFLFYELRLLFRVIRRFREVSKTMEDSAEAIRVSMHKEIGDGKIASVLLHDAIFLYFLLFSWRRKPMMTPSRRDDIQLFTYHKNTNLLIYTAMITKIILIESIAVHFFIQQWSSLAAWILTFADLWLLAVLWADCRASYIQPVRIKEDKLILRYGLRIQGDIPLTMISAVGYCKDGAYESGKEAITPILGTANVRIDLHQPVRVEGLLFLPRSVKTIYLAMDEPEQFIRDVSSRISGK
ncbi:hypothetical protein [Brevibacillus migulae]|uniref:hypothetical protein n=1 Tax=Brevibacillus migulae TaxID=1644114 RepID=UPI00106E8847|nr:hypothetical protein [Brevibacillus migulae]